MNRTEWNAESGKCWTCRMARLSRTHKLFKAMHDCVLDAKLPKFYIANLMADAEIITEYNLQDVPFGWILRECGSWMLVHPDGVTFVGLAKNYGTEVRCYVWHPIEETMLRCASPAHADAVLAAVRAEHAVIRDMFD